MMPLRSSRLLKTALCSTLALTAAQACGPDFFPDTFVRTARPDLPEQFVKGKLGLLQPGFARADLFVAYRYLYGGTLDSTEQKGWEPTYPLSEQEYGPQDPEPSAKETNSAPDTPLARWVLARNAFSDAPPGPIGQEGSIEVHTTQGFHYEDHFLNCADDAFRTATETLQTRAKLWGKTSPYLLDWLHSQDTVFSNCSGPAAVPSSAPAGSPALLVADRAYQTAAAHFYGRAFPTAAQEFIAISKDKSSPWQPISGYLAGRVLIRQAFFARPDAEAQADYDPAIMRSAEDQLRAYLASNPAPEWHSAAGKQFALIRIRLDPEQRTRELASLISGPNHDANYTQDLQDLLWITAAKTPDGLRAEPELYRQVPDEANPKSLRFVTEQEAEKAAAAKRLSAFDASASERSLGPILDWTLTVQSLSTDAPQHALDQWRNTHALPWLVAALVLAPNGTTSVSDLLEAGASVPVSSPAWETVGYHRARLLIAAGHLAEARVALTGLSSHFQEIPAADREPSTVNALRGLGMVVAPTAAEFLSFASRSMLLASSEEHSSVQECQEVMKNPVRHYNCDSHVGPEQLDKDAARIFNEQAPLPFWLAAAQSSSLSPQLRNAIAEEGWTRATLLGDKVTSASFLALTPQPLREQAVAGGSPLAPWMTLARNPGLRPYLSAGTQRAYSYDFVESYRDNWCYKPDASSDSSLPVAFLKPAERKSGKDDAERLANIRSLYVGRQIIDRVQSDVHDPQAAEALFLILRMIRYGCTEPAQATAGTGDVYAPVIPYSQEAKDLLQLKRDAARLLRQHYAASPWTKKAAPFVG